MTIFLCIHLHLMTFIDIRRPERQRRECEPIILIDIPIIKEAGRAQRHDCFSFKRADLKYTPSLFRTTSLKPLSVFIYLSN